MKRRNFIVLLTSCFLIAGGFSFALAKNYEEPLIKEVDAATDINDYSACESAHNNGSASALLTALRNITAPGSSGSYDKLWDTYKTAYVRSDGKIFDYYSSITNFRPGTDQAGSYSGEGDKYNREHSIPKSWWGGSTSNQGADPFIVIPTDGYVNGRRSNYPLGMVNSATYTSSGGFSKLGSAVTSWGYSGTVFEPNDSVKGDLARIHFYAIAKYSASYGWTSGEGSSTFAGNANTNFGLTNYAVKLFSFWSNLDPVSDWERSVNNALASIQGNRNPFIDHPEYANTLWGNVSGYTTYSESSTPTPDKTLSSIEVSDPKTSYTVDDSFVKPTVIAHFTDNSSSTVTNSATFTGYNLSVAGNQTVTVSYIYGGTTKTTTYSITVASSGGGGSGGGEGEGHSGEEVTLDIDFAGNKSSDTDTDGNTWSANGTYVVGASYLRLDNTTTYIKNVSTIAIDPNSDVSFKIYARTYGGTNSRSITVAAYNSSDVLISNVATITPTSSTLTELSGTLTFTSTSYHNVFIKVSNAGTGQVGISTMQFTYTSFVEESSTKELESISVKTAPSTTSYDVGETFDPTGLVITLSYSDSSTEDVSYSGHESSFSFDPSLVTQLTALDTYVTIYYGGFDCDQSITVSSPKTLSSISISGYTTSFVEGDTFSFGGTVTANFSDSTSENVTASATFSGYNMTTVGDQTVIVSYTYKDVNKTHNYNISVEKGTLSSISVSGQTTVYQKNNAFAFDGTCTATFANGYKKVVTPTSVTSPDMSIAGNKTITVSFTYNGNTRTTTYDITVNSDRTVIETTEVSGTITWPSSNVTITGKINGLSTSVSGNKVYESSSLRLGTGSGGGTLSISASIAITTLTISAKYYSSSYSSSVLKVDGQSISPLTSGYQEYEISLSAAKTSFTILTENKNSRVNIQSITLYSVSEQDISTSSDCIGLESFITNYMHMDYVQNLGYCKDNEHHYYSTAKSAFNSLNEHQRSLFTSNSAYVSEWARLQSWASFNNDSLNSSNQLESPIVPLIISTQRVNSVLVVTIVTAASVISIVVLFVIKRCKKEE